ncbi:MAG: WD40 repeat domain-containing protein [Gemmataceae bacterium]|nr:WD40 repeat domain-containing protein [Gemmataceae bacterium]
MRQGLCILAVVVALQAPAAEQRRDHRSNERCPRLDFWGDPLPEGALARLGTLRFWHSEPILALAFSPDGKTLVSGSRDHRIRLWDVATGKERRQLLGHEGPVSFLTFSPDGKTLLSKSEWLDPVHPGDGTVRLWDVTTGKEARRLPVPRRGGLALRFGPEPQVVPYAAAKGQLRFQHPLTGKELRLPRAPRPDSEEQEGTQDAMLAFSPDGKLFVTAEEDQSILLWDAASGRVLRRLHGHEQMRFGPGLACITALRFSPNSTFVLSASNDETVRVWDAVAGKELWRWKVSGRQPPVLTFSPSGKLLALAQDEGIYLRETATGDEVRQLKSPRRVGAIAFSPDGRTLAATVWGRALCLWDVATGDQLALHGHPAPVRFATFSPDGRTVLSGDAVGEVRTWNPTTGRQFSVEQPGILESGVSSVAVSADRRVIALGAGEQTIAVLSTTTLKEIRRFQPGANWQVASLALSADGKRLAWGSCSRLSTEPLYEVCVREVASGKDLGQRSGAGTSVALSPDGGTFAATVSWLVERGEGPLVRLWAIGTSKELGPQWAGAALIERLAFSPDSQSLACGQSNGIVRLWHLPTKKERIRFRGSQDEVTALGFSPDGKRLAVASADHVIRLWDVQTGKELSRFEGHSGKIEGLAFAPDGRALLSWSADTTMLLWEVAAGLARGLPAGAP